MLCAHVYMKMHAYVHMRTKWNAMEFQSLLFIPKSCIFQNMIQSFQNNHSIRIAHRHCVNNIFKRATK